ncbi:hypothetical protein C8R41DRAFT_976778 [Lentinula lateritia]|uniref:Uncharacterized protein n=1 Tax=Lentinula lateritia TaxID=40482 RepID=A0ABQ8W1F1_9AGAR|nr:hypothetical protein C8R41DRAFT_976778 [Lentinula lateritia]
MFTNKLAKNKRMHPYAHALRRQKEYLNEVALANTLPPPQNTDIDRGRIEEKIDRPLDQALIVFLVVSAVVRILNYYILNKIISSLEV